MLYGSGHYTYELRDSWAKLPQGVSFVDVVGLIIDSEDNVYFFNRGKYPVMLFDREGHFLT